MAKISPKDNENYKCTDPKCLTKLNIKIMKKTAPRHRIIITLNISAKRKNLKLSKKGHILCRGQI